jgi:hypothetical protein
VAPVFFENFNDKSEAKNKAGDADKENYPALVIIQLMQKQILGNNEHYYRNKK